MSNQSIAASQLQPMSSPAVSESSKGFWRVIFDAWVASYTNRIDSNGKVLFDL